MGGFGRCRDIRLPGIDRGQGGRRVRLGGGGIEVELGLAAIGGQRRGVVTLGQCVHLGLAFGGDIGARTTATATATATAAAATAAIGIHIAIVLGIAIGHFGGSQRGIGGGWRGRRGIHRLHRGIGRFGDRCGFRHGCHCGCSIATLAAASTAVAVAAARGLLLTAVGVAGGVVLLGGHSLCGLGLLAGIGCGVLRGRALAALLLLACALLFAALRVLVLGLAVLLRLLASTVTAITTGLVAVAAIAALRIARTVATVLLAATLALALVVALAAFGNGRGCRRTGKELHHLG